MNTMFFATVIGIVIFAAAIAGMGALMLKSISSVKSDCRDEGLGAMITAFGLVFGGAIMLVVGAAVLGVLPGYGLIYLLTPPVLSTALAKVGIGTVALNHQVLSFIGGIISLLGFLFIAALVKQLRSNNR